MGQPHRAHKNARGDSAGCRRTGPPRDPQGHRSGPRRGDWVDADDSGLDPGGSDGTSRLLTSPACEPVRPDPHARISVSTAPARGFRTMTMLDRMRRHKNWLKWSLALVV